MLGEPRLILPRPMRMPGDSNAGCLGVGRATGRMDRCSRAARQPGMFVKVGESRGGPIEGCTCHNQTDRRTRSGAFEARSLNNMSRSWSCSLSAPSGSTAYQPDITVALTASASLPLEEQPAARRAVRDRMLRLLAPDEDDPTQQYWRTPRGGVAALIPRLKTL